MQPGDADQARQPDVFSVPLEPPELRRAPDGTLIGRLAPVTMRVIAQVLSGMLWALVQTAVTIAIVITSGERGDATGVGFMLVWFAPFAVNTLLVAFVGWDPGKLALGLRVVNGTGRPPGLFSALVRTAVVHLPLLSVTLPSPVGDVMAWLYVPWLIGLIVTMARDADNRGWQDKAARTWVVTRDRDRAA
jgi:uncharacterized RDD family membrane protein YckC